MSTSSNHCLLGLDVGGTAIKAVALDASNKVIASTELPSNAHIDPTAVRRAISDTVLYFKNLNLSYTSLGIGCAGSVEPGTGLVRNSPNFANWKNVPLGDWIRADLNLEVRVDNDANCAVLGEWIAGAAKNATNVVLITLGTGVGGGLILNGRLYRGATGSGAELGHLSIRSNGIPCPCGNTGCFERYCSASALKKMDPNHTAKQIFELAESNPIFKQIVQNFLADLKVGLVSLGNIFDPDILLLGGAVSSGLIPYIEELRRWVREKAFPSVGSNMKIEFTELKNESGAIGAALLVKDH